MILQSGFLDIYSGPEFHFWEWISPLGDSCERGFFNLRGGGGSFKTFFKNIYLSHLNVWSCSAFLFLQSCNSLHTAQAWFCELYMRWPFMPGSHIGLFRLQCVCSPCVVRKRCRSSTDFAFTQESATGLWLFTTNTTFIHYFDFKHLPPVSQTRLKPSPRLKCNSELNQLKITCTDWS